jgi:hypothetical protein
MASLLFGCSSLSSSKISNEQISDDLSTIALTGQNNSDLSLRGSISSQHCFQVKGSKFNGDSADIKLFLSATEIMPDGDEVKVVIGDVNLSYKKDGDKWKLDKVDSKDLDIKSMSMADTLTKFAPLAKPICAVFSSSNRKK